MYICHYIGYRIIYKQKLTAYDTMRDIEISLNWAVANNLGTCRELHNAMIVIQKNSGFTSGAAARSISGKSLSL